MVGNRESIKSLGVSKEEPVVTQGSTVIQKLRCLVVALVNSGNLAGGAAFEAGNTINDDKSMAVKFCHSI